MRICLTSEDGSEPMYAVGRLPFTVGGNADCDVGVQGLGISPYHCYLDQVDGTLFVWDLGSTQGTYLNGNPVSQAAVKPGDVLTLGLSSFRVQFSATGEEDGPVADRATSGEYCRKSTMPIRVLLADDHPVLRNSLAMVLVNESDIDVIGQAGDGQEAVELVRSLRPEVVLMDISMPRVNGITATRAITAEFPDVRVIGVTKYDEAGIVGAMQRAGCVGLVSKGTSPEVLLNAIRRRWPTPRRPVRQGQTTSTEGEEFSCNRAAANDPQTVPSVP